MSLLTSIALLGGIGAVGAVMLNGVVKKFHVDEDPRIAEIESVLPGANCGGCGFKGCHDFAVNCHGACSLDGFNCPVAGDEVMKKIGAILGVESKALSPKIAVVRCAGTSETKTPNQLRYSGPRVCAIVNTMVGDYECLNSCLGCGDCVEACKWNAIRIPTGASTPIVKAINCTGCGMCAVVCPRHIIDIRQSGPRGRRVWVACSNCQKGAVARKQCTVACIGCGLCVKACPFDAIKVSNNLAYIDAEKCKTCGKCVSVCPTHAINCNFELSLGNC